MDKTYYYLEANIPFGENGPLANQRYTESGYYGREAFTLAYPFDSYGPTLYDSKEKAEEKIPKVAEKFNIDPKIIKIRKLKITKTYGC